MQFRIVTVIILAGVIAASARAERTKIVYHHRNGTIEARTIGNRLLHTVEAGTGDRLDIYSGKPARVWIHDPNPVLFSYKWEEVTFADNPDYAAALSWAKTISPISGLMGPKLEAGPSQDETAKAVTELQRLAKMMPDIARLTIGDPNAVSAARTQVSAWPLTSLESTIDSFYSELRKVNPAGLKSSNTASLTQGLGGTPSTPNPFQTGTGVAKPQTPALAQPPPAPAAVPSGVDPAIFNAFVQEDDIRKTLTTVKAFATAVMMVDSPQSFPKEVPYDLSKNPTAHVTITPQPAFKALAEATGRAIGTVDIPLQPYYPAHFSVGPSLVYSFVKASTFTTEKQTDGTYKILENSSEYRGTNVSAMFSVTPRRWSEPTLGGSFQIGISPVKDQIGFFGGGQLRITNLIKLGLGYAYQQVPKLAKGLSLDVPVAAPDALKTTPDFEGGFYVSFDITLPKP